MDMDGGNQKTHNLLPSRNRSGGSLLWFNGQQHAPHGQFGVAVVLRTASCRVGDVHSGQFSGIVAFGGQESHQTASDDAGNKKGDDDQRPQVQFVRQVTSRDDADQSDGSRGDAQQCGLCGMISKAGTSQLVQ